MSYLHLGQDLAFGEPGAPAVAPTTPALRFHPCASGCAPHAANECHDIVRQAVRDATWLAENAAAKLKARDGQALRLFGYFFGDPGPVPWAANNQPAVDLVADRFQAVADGFRKRVPHFRCSTRNSAIPGTVPTFWRAAVLLHEMLHLLYWQFFGHQTSLTAQPRPGDPAERRRDNARCYEAFALRVAEHGADPHDVTCCRRPATAGC